MVILTIQTSQYVSGSQSTVKTADFEIIVRHHVSRKYLYNRTTKAKLGSKVSLIGELDIHEDKLCLELHNFDFISTNTTPYTSSTSTSPPLSSPTSSASEKRSLLYESLTTPTKRQKTSPTTSPTQIKIKSEKNLSTSLSTAKCTPDEDNLVVIDDPPATKKKTTKRELRSSTKVKKLSDLASTKPMLPPPEKDYDIYS